MPSGPSPRPTLTTIHGETPGKVYDLDRESTIIGRDLGCDIILSRKFISRRHARIIRRFDGFHIEDLQSNCGTVVDGIKIVGRVPLQDGQNIKIGNYLFVFHFPAIEVRDGEETGSTILGVLEVSRARPAPDTPTPVPTREKLRQVLEITRKLGESLNVDDVLEKTLDSLFKFFPQADRGFVLLNQGGSVDFNPRAIKFRPGISGNLTISRTILKLVVNEGKAILSSDLANDRRFEMSQSIVGAIRMMMCVPLLDAERRPGGILQIDTCDDRGTFTEDDLDLLVAIASQVGVAVENARLHSVLIAQTQIEQESQDAQEVQLALLPERRPELPGYEFWDYYEPARFVGGDYFDYLPLANSDGQASTPSRRWLVALGDVAGKGMPGALLMARLSAEVRLFALTMSDPAAIVERLNRDFCHRAIGDRFITFLLVMIDAEAHRITVVSAGHAGPLIRRSDDSLEILGESQALTPLGVAETAVYRTASAELGPGDMVLLYTDGLPDSTDAAAQPFTLDRLKQTFRAVPRGARGAGEEIIRAVREHSSGCPQEDDITVLCFGREAAGNA
jgi:serine phosphatase RsbU (regulator of sigma subunit)/pSer/pThr/pTyr-binding forkhead associated (FHA) protein